MTPLLRDCAFPLLGSRTYLHGTTLFDAMLAHVPECADLCFRIPHRIDTDRVRLCAGGTATPDRSRASLAWTREGACGVIIAEPLPASEMPGRVPYPEHLVADVLDGSPQAVTLQTGVGMSLVSSLIPMFKALLRSAPAHTAPGQWMFTRLDISYPPREFTPLMLRSDAFVAGRLARAVIESRGDGIGHIYFSWVPAE